MSSEATKVVGLYERNAKNFDKDRGRDLFEKGWLLDFFKLLPPGGSILDVGCGSAEPIGRFLIEQGHLVTGVDSSPSLIGICEQQFLAQDWIVVDMREFCLNEEFNGIAAWDSLFHLSPQHQRLMFPIFRKHSAPNAALLFTSGPSGGEIIGEYKVSLCTTAVWMALSTANCLTAMDSRLFHTSWRTLRAGVTRSGSPSFGSQLL